MMTTRCRVARWGFALLLCSLACAAHADVFRPAYLELREAGDGRYDVLWKVPAQGDRRLALQVRFPQDTAQLSEPVEVLNDGASAARWQIRREGGLVGQRIRIEGIASGVTDVIVRIEREDGTGQVERLLPEQSAFIVKAATGTGEVVKSYLVLGVEHILGGFDHLLFVLALLLICRGGWKLVKTVTTFTIAHSVTLTAATLGWVRVPGPPVEAVIALSIVFVAAEILHGRQGREGFTARAPWVVALTFGLLHGFGFAGALSEVGLPQTHIPLALLFFNIGVELGQLLFVAVVLSLGALVRRANFAAPRWAQLVPGYAIGSVAMFWVIQRVAAF